MIPSAVEYPEHSALARRSFVVAQNARGRWVARERHGLIEGVFFTQREAVRFALFETGRSDKAVVVVDAKYRNAC